MGKPARTFTTPANPLRMPMLVPALMFVMTALPTASNAQTATACPVTMDVLVQAPGTPVDAFTVMAGELMDSSVEDAQGAPTAAGYLMGRIRDLAAGRDDATEACLTLFDGHLQEVVRSQYGEPGAGYYANSVIAGIAGIPSHMMTGLKGTYDADYVELLATWNAYFGAWNASPQSGDSMASMVSEMASDPARADKAGQACLAGEAQFTMTYCRGGCSDFTYRSGEPVSAFCQVSGNRGVFLLIEGTQAHRFSCNADWTGCVRTHWLIEGEMGTNDAGEPKLAGWWARASDGERTKKASFTFHE